MTEVKPLGASSWDELVKLKADGWLWLDMEEGGLHHGTLPAAQPAQLSHLWGWSATELVRVRVDASLPGGMVGARVAVVDAGSAQDVTVWGNDSGKIRMPGRDFHDDSGAPTVILQQHVVAVTSTQGSGSTRVPLTFYRLVTGGK